MTAATDRFDTWFPRIARAASFLTGTLILAYSAFGSLPERPWLYAAAVALMVPPAAGQFESLLRASGAGPPASKAASTPPSPAPAPPSPSERP